MNLEQKQVKIVFSDSFGRDFAEAVWLLLQFGSKSVKLVATGEQ